MPEGVTVPPASWRNASLLIGAFYVLLGFVNIWVAMTRSEADWVTFKVWIAVPAGDGLHRRRRVLYLLRGAFTKEGIAP